MESIPIKKPWKNPERIFVKRFKKGEPYYCKYTEFFPDGSYKTSIIREPSHCNQWQAVIYLGTDIYDCPAYYFAFQWKGFLTKKEAMRALQKYLEQNKAMGLVKLPSYQISEELPQDLKDNNAA